MSATVSNLFRQCERRATALGMAGLHYLQDAMERTLAKLEENGSGTVHNVDNSYACGQVTTSVNFTPFASQEASVHPFPVRQTRPALAYKYDHQLPWVQQQSQTEIASAYSRTDPQLHTIRNPNVGNIRRRGKRSRHISTVERFSKKRK